MGFEALLGNRQLKENLTHSLRSGRASHFYLICGPEGSGRHTLADLLAAALQCQGENAPCGVCEACRKVLSHCHPDVITLTDPEHKKVAVKLVRQMREDVFICPNEGRHKIYLLPQELGPEGQNALLKILEEPPAYAVFLLLTDQAEKLLPTVRSRSVELRLLPLEEQLLHRHLRAQFPEQTEQAISAAIARSGGFLGQAVALLRQSSERSAQTEQFIRAYSQADALLLAQTLVPMEKWKRDALIPELEQWLNVVQSAQLCRAGVQMAQPEAAQIASARSGVQLHAAIENLNKAIECAQQNVSPAAVCGWLLWALR